MYPALDDVDRRLIGALHLVPRATWDDLGAVLAIDPSTLKRRFDRLAEARMIRVIGQAHWGLHSTTMPVNLFLDISGDTPLTVLGRVGALPHVVYLAQISGDYPAYVGVHAPSQAETSATIDRLYAIPGIRRVATLPALATPHRGGHWDPQFLTDAEQQHLLKLTGMPAETEASIAPPAKPLTDAERTMITLLQQDGRATAAGLGRAAGLPTSTAHRMVRRILDEGWIRPRLEVVSEWLGFATQFVLRLRVAPGQTAEVIRRVDQLPQTRLSSHVAGDTSVLCTGLVTDPGELATFIDYDLATIPGILTAGVDVVLAQLRRYWLDRDPATGLGQFHAPPLL
ncbi:MULTISPECIES: Lrp/AsnC family transcriptional regulator [unclassified Crossiella]|uniref:Lrp/AsnC family transcriptional regulator n=1 Tax=unclassified Crossiella TaxID=2620835 RepID=UPI001FFF0769|nr:MULTISPECIES: Lrp/AsnC family transcriptional regulator [unclassified Crossiella]MCK2244351.1 Lrp/AsnC family transcriptional regulator [Crossiella sp. S99.2]MCK2257821.1 Lrp/AsnC family transcriptional regulator [Crossiella sp. S99.1]